jgi:hypothetical protein
MMIQNWKNKLKLLIHKFKLRFLIPLGIYDTSILRNELIPEWKARINDVIECPDNKKIKREKNAGIISNGKQFMHNGIPVTVGGYYGSEIAQMLLRNQGVHEPQEEYSFELVLRDIKKGSTMLELGCYWAFYSIWFLKKVKNGKSFLIEPDKFNIEYGKNNFRLNDITGDFTNAFIGRTSYLDNNKNRFLSVPDFMKLKGIDFIDILHSDIQGHELDMLLSIKEELRQKKIGYLFISTHTDQLHYDCLKILIEMEYIIVCHADLKNTFSYDGLIVAKSLTYSGIEKIQISLKEDKCKFVN